VCVCVCVSSVCVCCCGAGSCRVGLKMVVLSAQRGLGSALHIVSSGERCGRLCDRGGWGVGGGCEGLGVGALVSVCAGVSVAHPGVVPLPRRATQWRTAALQPACGLQWIPSVAPTKSWFWKAATWTNPARATARRCRLRSDVNPMTSQGAKPPPPRLRAQPHPCCLRRFCNCVWWR
jgi:hypothetical protein